MAGIITLLKERQGKSRMVIMIVEGGLDELLLYVIISAALSCEDDDNFGPSARSACAPPHRKQATDRLSFCD